MPEVKLPESGITFEGVIYVIALAVAVSGVLVALVKGWEAWKKISVRDRVKQLEGRMEKVEARLKLGDKRFDLQNDDMGHMLNTQQALLLHFISGNDHDRLRTQLTELGNYMSERATKIQRYAEEQNEIISGGD
jgi:uncharacterized membrane protein affecting hemolysin expression